MFANRVGAARGAFRSGPSASKTRGAGVHLAGPVHLRPLPPSHQGLAVHIHPHVQILVNGRDVPIPANLGITTDAQGRATGFLPIHTHDGTGTLHVESPTARGFTLKDFFDRLGFVLSSTELAGFLVEVGQSVRVTVNGQASRVPRRCRCRTATTSSRGPRARSAANLIAAAASSRTAPRTTPGSSRRHTAATWGGSRNPPGWTAGCAHAAGLER